MQLHFYLPLCALALIVSACGGDDARDAFAEPTAFDCANAVRHGTSALQGLLEGKLLVRVETQWKNGRRTDSPPLAGALVRVEKDGRRFEATTTASGCVEFEDAALVPPLTVHVFSMNNGYTTWVADPRRVQMIPVRVRDETPPPIDELPPVAYLEGNISGTERIREPSDGRQRLVGVVAGRSYFELATWFPVLAEPGRYAIEVPHDTPLTVLAGGAIGYDGERYPTFLEHTHIGVGTAPPIALGSSYELNIALDIAIDKPRRVVAPALPASAFGDTSISIWLDLPNGPSMTLNSTSGISGELLAVELTGALAGASLYAAARMRESYVADPYFGSRAQSVTTKAAPIGDLELPEWMEVKSRLTLDERGVRLDIEGADQCSFAAINGGWRVYRFGPPFEVEFPELPAGFEYPTQPSSYSASCVRVLDGYEPYDLEAPVDATFREELMRAF